VPGCQGGDLPDEEPGAAEQIEADEAGDEDGLPTLDRVESGDSSMPTG
jgi:hypothetical protein